MAVLAVEEDIIKSPQDEREYRFLKLSNELKVLLVSDTATEKAAAALAVRVGYLCDPDDIPGLAHFCEHMLFLGTEKFPSENEYTQFLSHHGGSANAFTSAEYTTYFFDVACDNLHGTLDRFAQFFICPLFNADAKDREVKAVDSENDKNLQVDNWRYRQVCKETAKPGHPYRKFGSGNKYSLETRPLELGIDVRDELLKFHSSYYSANLMSLVVLGKESLDELAVIVDDLFSPVVNRNVPTPEFPDHPYSDNELQAWIEFVPVKELRQIQLRFPLPDLTEHYASDPMFYVSHLVGHEGQGSILSYLKDKGWCHSLSAGPGAGAKGYMFFDIGMEMTEEGEDHIEDIVTAVFQYLAMLRREGPREWIFKECSDINRIIFQFKDKPRPRPYVQMLSHHLHDFPPREVLSARYFLTKFRPELIQLVMDKLQPQFLRVGLISKRFEGKTELVEPWYGGQYSFKKMDPQLIEKWSSIAPIEELHLPAVNEFIPTNFDILHRPEDSPKVPVLIQDTPMTKVWYKQDDTFFLPKACLYFRISTPLAFQDPASCDLTTLFVWLLREALNEYAYSAEIAGIGYKILNDPYGIKVEISGYNHKEATLLSKLMSKMTQFTVDPQQFSVYKEVVERELRNFKTLQPYQHANYFTAFLLDNLLWSKDELAEALDDVTAEKLQAFIPNLLSRVHIEALIHGNASTQTCLEVVAIVEEALKTNTGSKPMLPSQMSRHRQIQLPDGSSYLYCHQNEVHNSSCIDVYLQIGMQATHPNMLLELLVQVIAEPCFDTLRTKEQLGYIVGSGVRRANGAQGLRVLVQSEKDPAFVERRVEAFLQQMQQKLESLTEEEFERHKQALAVRRLEKPKKLKDECAKHWTEILSQQYYFNRDEEEVLYLTGVTKLDLIAFFKEHIANGAPCRHKLVVHVIPENSKDSSPVSESLAVAEPASKSGIEETDSAIPLPAEPTQIADFVAFKNSLPLYPLVKPYI